MKRVLIVRPSSIGDIVMASPMIPALRKAYPGAYIAWVSEPAGYGLLKNNRALDEIICLPKARWKDLVKRGRWIALGKEVKAFARAMQRRQFDTVLDAQGLLRSRVIARLSCAQTRIGFDSREPGKGLMTRIVSRGADVKEVSSEYRHLMQSLGIPTRDFAMEVILSSEDQQAAKKALQRQGIGGDYAVICPFTTRAQKHWPEERWAALATALFHQRDLPVLVLGGPADTAAARRIRARTEGAIHDLTGTLSLTQSAAVVQGAALVIGVDTGLTHTGVSFHRPTMALFGPTCPYLYPPNAHTRILYHKEPCSPCRRRPTCHGTFPCMASIRVAHVVRTATTLLQETQTDHAHPTPRNR